MNKIILLLFFVFCGNYIFCQKVFSDLDSLLLYAESKSTVIQTNKIILSETKWSKIAALLSIPEIYGNGSVTFLDNTKLQTSLFPSEFFGDEPGKYKEVTIGSKYNTSLNLSLEVKLLNLIGIENYKYAKINYSSAKINSQINKKKFFENIAVLYYNILNINEQIKASIVNESISDSIYHIVNKKYEIGLARKQELNDALSNYYNTVERTTQNRYLLQQQYIALKILCDIPEFDSILIIQNIHDYDLYNITPVFNTLKIKDSEIKVLLSESLHRKSIYNFLPTISLLLSLTKQQNNSTFKLYDKNSDWMVSSYIGLKLSIPFPINANRISEIYKTKYDYQISKQTSLHTKVETEFEFKQLLLDFDKTKSEFISNVKILTLKKESYEKNLDIYKQGMIGLDILLQSYKEMISSQSNYLTSLVNTQFYKSKIQINNKVH